MNPLSVAIIGTGNIAGGYDEKKLAGEEGVYSHAGAYQLHGGFRLNAVYDTDRERGAAFCKRWNGAENVESLAEIRRMQHDVISVCTPDGTHADIVRELLQAGCCKTIFVEKPLAATTGEAEEIMQLTQERGINVVVNFQRRNEVTHRELSELIAARPDHLLSVSGHYMKGLRHIGITMIDTLIMLCGHPLSVQAYNRAFNREADEYSYEFILYFAAFTASVKTVDSERLGYNYHLFEIDLLLADGRKTLVDISQALREAPVTPYAYSGVKVINERQAVIRDTGYKFSMQDAVAYLHEITSGRKPHVTNTPQSFYNDLLVVEKVIESYERGSVKLDFEPQSWKK
jgi:predicted dehydrogenase